MRDERYIVTCINTLAQGQVAWVYGPFENHEQAERFCNDANAGRVQGVLSGDRYNIGIRMFIPVTEQQQWKVGG